MNDLLVSIILPVYNQADHLHAIVTSFMDALNRATIRHELILVVNGPCKDDSLGVARTIEQESANVHVLHSEAGGWGLAVKLGLLAAKGDLLCYTNSARTTPQDLLLCVVYAKAFPDTVVKANRRIRESTQRRLGSLLYNLQCRMLFDLAYWDINGTPKVFPRTCVKLLSLQRSDDLIDLEFNVVCRTENYPVIEVPILSTRRHGGRSTTGWKTAVRLYYGAYRMAVEPGGED